MRMLESLLATNIAAISVLCLPAVVIVRTSLALSRRFSAVLDARATNALPTPTTKAGSTNQTRSPTRHAAPMRTVLADVASTTPGTAKAECIELVFVFFLDWRPVFGTRHRLTGSVDV